VSDAPYRRAAGREPDEPPLDPAKPWALQTWVSERNCPRCEKALFAARKDGFRIDACGLCGGSWLATADALRMVEQRSSVPSDLARIASAQGIFPDPGPEGRPCLDCGKPLQRFRIPGGPEIDTCDRDGTWFDAHELEELARTILKRLPPMPTPDADRAIEEITRKARTREEISDAVFWVVEALLTGGRGIK
jgi:Zn-finger nucleic acid-binding protein